MGTSGPFKNVLLKSFSKDIIERLHLSPVTLEVGHEIEYPGTAVDHLFFVEEGMASMTNTFEDGSQVEVGMFGFEGVIGISALMGTKRSLNRIYTQIPGRGSVCSLQNGEREFQRGELFHKLTLRYVQAQLVQTMQSAGCNAKHNMEQRLARWLLLCADRANAETFKMSHDFLSHMLGSTRSTVSLTAATLKKAGLIEYNQGTIRILKRSELERFSCECYRTIKDHLDNYAEYDSGTTA